MASGARFSPAVQTRRHPVFQGSGSRPPVCGTRLCWADQDRSRRCAYALRAPICHRAGPPPETGYARPTERPGNPHPWPSGFRYADPNPPRYVPSPAAAGQEFPPGDKNRCSGFGRFDLTAPDPAGKGGGRQAVAWWAARRCRRYRPVPAQIACRHRARPRACAEAARHKGTMPPPPAPCPAGPGTDSHRPDRASSAPANGAWPPAPDAAH